MDTPEDVGNFKRNIKKQMEHSCTFSCLSFISDAANCILLSITLHMRVALKLLYLFVVGAKPFPANQNVKYECFHVFPVAYFHDHYTDVIMGAVVSKLTSLMIVYLTVYSSGDQRLHQSSASLAFVGGTHRWPQTSPHTGPVTQKILPFVDVIMILGQYDRPWFRTSMLKKSDKYIISIYHEYRQIKTATTKACAY